MHYKNLLRHLKLIALSTSMAMLITSASWSETGSSETAELTRPETLYDALCLSDYGLNRQVLDAALEGFEKLSPELTTPVLSIVDFSQPSTARRLYIIDVGNKKLLFNTYVAHGKNSGEIYATSFSDAPESHQSSLGFYITGDVYSGKHGTSLKLKGMSQGLNTNAEDRCIVLHGADYVSEDFIRKTGRLGRSFGCPAVASELAIPIINEIKNGSCLYIYHP